jgi:hypothetical protein
MTASRLGGRRGDGAAVVRGWVAFYTLGLPAEIRGRRRAEVAGDLADETLDAVRRGATGDLRQRRLVRLLLGIRDDLAWRVVDARSMARASRSASLPSQWTPTSKVSLTLLAIVAIGAGGALGIVLVPWLDGSARPDGWLGWGPYGFIVACAIVLGSVLLAVPWPSRGLRLGIGGVVLGMAAAPWLWGCWMLALIALAVRWRQSNMERGGAR